MRTRRWFRPRLAAAALVCLLAACGDEPSLPGPGTLIATVTGPNGPEGAAIVVVYGSGVEGYGAASGTQLHAATQAPGVDRLVLIHPAGGPLTFEITLADTLTPPTFGIEQVAGPDDALRADLTPYAVELSR